jgi:hypothetical protein
MHISTYCVFTLIVAVVFCFAAPTKAPTGCGYEVREHLNTSADDIKYNVSLGM